MPDMPDKRRLRDSELTALVSLLGDRDRSVVAHCTDRLLHEADRAFPLLEQAVASNDLRLRKRAAHAMTAIGRARAEQALLDWVGPPDSSIDLEGGAFRLMRTAYPDADEATYRHRLDEVAESLALRVRDLREPGAIADELSAAISDDLRLQGNADDYYDPDNSFMNQVLDRGLGIPITLAAVYLFVARRLDLPVFGVGMPSHFLLKFGRDGELFMDPFDGGIKLTRDDCRTFMRRAGIPDDASYLDVTPDRFIFARMLANLVHVYERRRDTANRERYARLLEAVRGE